MSKRWDFKFRRYYDEVKLLGLDFMVENEPEEDPIEEPNNPRSNPDLSIRKITKEMVEKIYELSKKVYENMATYADVIIEAEDFGMNPSSAAMYVECFQKMMSGILYTRGTSVFAAEYYINKIREDYGVEYSNNAIEALRRHIDYLHSTGSKNNGLQEVLKNQETLT
jgi:hypothetical protein